MRLFKRRKRPAEQQSRDVPGPVLVGLIVVTIVADVMDFWAWRTFLERKGGVGGLAPSLEYLGTWPGMILTFLGLAPLIILIVWGVITSAPERDRR